ncbi:MAG: hypothetical protein ACRDK7_04300 [Solirubrobacteraceae bacterium]
MTRTTYERAQRALILQLLRDDHERRWCRAELERQLDDIAPIEISDALEGLARAEAVRLDGDAVYASPCARHMSALELIGV